MEIKILFNKSERTELIEMINALDGEYSHDWEFEDGNIFINNLYRIDIGDGSMSINLNECTAKSLFSMIKENNTIFKGISMIIEPLIKNDLRNSKTEFILSKNEPAEKVEVVLNRICYDIYIKLEAYVLESIPITDEFKSEIICELNIIADFIAEAMASHYGNDMDTPKLIQCNKQIIQIISFLTTYNSMNKNKAWTEGCKCLDFEAAKDLYDLTNTSEKGLNNKK